MLKKIGRKITNNIGLKILAALFAIILWIVVVNIDDPVKASSYTTSITFENQNYISSKNKYFEVLDGDNTISFLVSAKRSLHQKLSNADFKATADMEKIEYDEERGIYRVPVMITQSKYNSEKVTITSKNMYKEVVLDDLGKIQKPILAQAGGTVAEGCALGEVSIVGSNIVKIQGPASIVSQIDKVAAMINVDGMSADLTDSVVPVFYDADENIIDTTKLKLSVSMVSINAKILNTKDVSLEFATKGKPAEGYVVTDISYKPATVRIKGEAEILNPINKITIPEEVLDLTDATGNIETTVDISSYLPEGTALVLNTDAKIKVKVKLELVKTKILEVPVSNITVGNLGVGCKSKFMTETILVEVSGPTSVIDALKANDVTGAADAGRKGNGEHLLKIAFEFGDPNCKVTTPVQIPVTITGGIPENTTTDSELDGNTGSEEVENGGAESGNTENGNVEG